MKQGFLRSAIVGLCIAVTFLFVSTSSAGAQVLAGSGEVAGDVGFANVILATGGTRHINFGGSGGYSPSSAVTVLGEYNFESFENSVKSQRFGGAAHFNFRASSTIVPYVVGGGGYERLSGGGASVGGYYAGGGGGASFYLSKHFGVRPEFRYEYRSYGTSFNAGAVASVSGSVFYQFGGQSGKKKKASTTQP